MAAVARVHKHSIEAIHHRISSALGHVRANVQELWVADILPENHQSMGWSRLKARLRGSGVCRLGWYLGNFPSTEVGEPFKWQRQHIRCSVNCEPLRRWNFLLTSKARKETTKEMQVCCEWLLTGSRAWLACTNMFWGCINMGVQLTWHTCRHSRHSKHQAWRIVPERERCWPLAEMES